MASQVAVPIHLEYLQSSQYEAKLSSDEDLFRHQAGTNSHNHHELHPWGSSVSTNSAEFDKLYAEANNQYMYHLWYKPELAPYMATEMVAIQPISKDMLTEITKLLHIVMESGIDFAMKTEIGMQVVKYVQGMFDEVGLKPTDQIFVRLGATSTKDSFAPDAPSAKPDPMAPDADIVVRRLLTSGRAAGRLLALSESIWPEDPGEALVIQRWSPNIDNRQEVRVFCFDGKVTAISQDVWWERTGWRDRYSEGFVPAILTLWDNVKDHLPFNLCTMDVLMTPSTGDQPWKAAIIEFNGFGAHLNTGSALYHWVNDADILEGRRNGITIRFIDDWEQTENATQTIAPPVTEDDELEPDWLALEKKLRASYARDQKVEPTPSKPRLPLRGRWCSAF